MLSDSLDLIWKLHAGLAENRDKTQTANDMSGVVAIAIQMSLPIKVRYSVCPSPEVVSGESFGTNFAGRFRGVMTV